MRDFVSYHWKFLKWKFSLWANLELKFCRKPLLENLKSHSWCFSWWFFVENRYNLVQGHKKHPHIPFFRGPALATPTTQYHGIMEIMQFYENAGLDFRYYTFFVYVLPYFAYQLILELPKWPNFNFIKLTINNC